jgi:hypothetical protein
MEPRWGSGQRPELQVKKSYSHGQPMSNPPGYAAIMKIQNPRSKDQSQKPGEGFKFQDSSWKGGRGSTLTSCPTTRKQRADAGLGNYKSRKAAAKAGGGFRRKSLILSTFINFYQVLTLKKDTMGTTQKTTGRFEYRHDRRTNFPSTCCKRHATSWDNSRSVFGAFVPPSLRYGAASVNP